MRDFVKTAVVMCSVLFLSGCVTVKGYSFRLDRNTGETEIVWHDIRSVKGDDDKNYDMAQEWASMEEALEKSEGGFDPEVAEVTEKEFFREGDALSVRYKALVKCPKCFPSRKTLLEFFHKEDFYFQDFVKGEFEEINNEIFFFLPADTKIISTNGKAISTGVNSIIVWPGDAELFEYHIERNGEPQGESFLSFFSKNLSDTDF